jgi:hypothetical protein
MTVAELSEHCRKHGLYPERIEAWKTACIGANSHANEQSKRSQQAAQLDQGCYSASESTLYQVLHEHDQVHPRGHQRAPGRKRMATTHKASAL